MTREDYNEILENDEIKKNTPQTKPVEKQPQQVENKKQRHLFKRQKPMRKPSKPKENNINKIIIIVTIAVLLGILIFVLLGALHNQPEPIAPNGQTPPNSQQQPPVPSAR